MRKIDILALVLLLTVLSGCRLNRPDDVLPPKKMEQFLYDYHLAQAVSQDLPKDEKYTTQANITFNAGNGNALLPSEAEPAVLITEVGGPHRCPSPTLQAGVFKTLGFIHQVLL